LGEEARLERVRWQSAFGSQRGTFQQQSRGWWLLFTSEDTFFQDSLEMRARGFAMKLWLWWSWKGQNLRRVIHLTLL
jgi:hypothetical protein